MIFQSIKGQIIACINEMYARDFALFTLDSGYLMAVCAVRLIAVSCNLIIIVHHGQGRIYRVQGPWQLPLTDFH